MRFCEFHTHKRQHVLSALKRQMYIYTCTIIITSIYTLSNLDLSFVEHNIHERFHDIIYIHIHIHVHIASLNKYTYIHTCAYSH